MRQCMDVRNLFCFLLAQLLHCCKVTIIAVTMCTSLFLISTDEIFARWKKKKCREKYFCRIYQCLIFLAVICYECTSRSSFGRVNFCPKNVRIHFKTFMKSRGGGEDDASMNNLTKVVWLKHTGVECLKSWILVMNM